MGNFFKASFLNHKQLSQFALPEKEVHKYRLYDGIYRRLKSPESNEESAASWFYTEHSPYIGLQLAIHHLAQAVRENDEPALYFQTDLFALKHFAVSSWLRPFLAPNMIRDIFDTPAYRQLCKKLESEGKYSFSLGEEEQVLNYSPAVEAFCRAIQKTGSHVAVILSSERITGFSWDRAEDNATAINSFFDCFKRELLSPKIKSRFKERKRAGERLFRNQLKYVDSLFRYNSTIGVTSIQLGYSNSLKTAFTLAQAQTDLPKLLNNIRCNSKFSRMIGYAWKLEYDILEGYSYHFIGFLNGSEISDADCDDFAHCLGRYWVQAITSGEGSYYLCKEVEVNKYRSYGDGLIVQGNFEKFQQLIWHISYMCQIDTFDIDVFPVNMRTMGYGQIKRNTTKALPEARHSSSMSDVYPDFSELAAITRDSTAGLSSILANSQINSQNSMASDERDHVFFNTL